MVKKPYFLKACFLEPSSRGGKRYRPLAHNACSIISETKLLRIRNDLSLTNVVNAGVLLNPLLTMFSKVNAFLPLTSY